MMSSMPRSRIVSATAPMIASVLRARSFMSTPMNVRSGTTPKILVCLTCPAITACVTPACCSTSRQWPRWPERHAVHGHRRRAERGRLEFGIRFLFDGDDRDVVAEAAGRVEHEEREPPVAGNQPELHRHPRPRLFVGVAGTHIGTPQGDPA